MSRWTMDQVAGILQDAREQDIDSYWEAVERGEIEDHGALADMIPGCREQAALASLEPDPGAWFFVRTWKIRTAI